MDVVSEIEPGDLGEQPTIPPVASPESAADVLVNLRWMQYEYIWKGGELYDRGDPPMWETIARAIELLTPPEASG